MTFAWYMCSCPECGLATESTEIAERWWHTVCPDCGWETETAERLTWLSAPWTRRLAEHALQLEGQLFMSNPANLEGLAMIAKRASDGE